MTELVANRAKLTEKLEAECRRIAGEAAERPFTMNGEPLADKRKRLAAKFERLTERKKA